MASKLAIALLLLGGVAHAQEAPADPPPVAPAEPEPTPPPEPPSPSTSTSTGTTSTSPSPSPSPSPSSSTKPDSGAIDTFILGLGFGIAGATGTPSEIYGPSYGLQLAFGIAHGPFSLEGRFGLGYGALPKQDALQGALTRGSLTQHSIIVRGQLPVGPVAIGAFVGVATGSVPILTAGADPDNAVRVTPADVEGIGATFGASAHLRLATGLELSAELAISQMSWDLPDAPYVTNPMSTGDTTTYTPSTADISSTIYAFTIALRGTIAL